MRKSHALIAAGFIAVPLTVAAADEPVYEIGWAEEQLFGYVPFSTASGEYHPEPAVLYADDFTLDETIELERIAWFGYSDYWDNPDLTNFTVWQVRIYKGQGQGFEPGEMIYDAVFEQAETSPEELGDYGLFDSIMYRQEVELDEPIELEAGQQYWLGIGSDAIDPGSDWWIWAQSPPHDQTVATWIWDDETWEIRYPDFGGDDEPYNVAFELFAADDETIPGDLTGDGTVGVADLLILLDEWGECQDPDDCPADLNGDGSVGVADLLILLDNWTS